MFQMISMQDICLQKETNLTVAQITPTLCSIVWDCEEEIETPPVYTYPADPLALVIHWKKVGIPTGLTSPFDYDIVAMLHKHPSTVEVEKHSDLYTPSPQSLEQAANIRTFYQQKYAYAMFMGDELSEFQTSLVRFLSQNNQNQLNKNDAAMLVSLPNFYVEDQEIIELMSGFNSFQEPEDPRRNHDYASAKLTLFKKRRTKYQKTSKYDYWFKDKKGRLYRLLVPMHTMEGEFLDKILLLNNNTIDFSGSVLYKKLFHQSLIYAHILGRYSV